MVQTSDFDDIANGTDVLYICEQENDAGKVYFNNLLVDITTDTTDGLNKKLGRNFEKIMSASSGAKIKYYENIKNQYKGEISEVIPVVLGLDKENASRLMLDCLEVAEGNKTKKEIENHPASIIFLEEMKRQFEAYSKAIENSPKKTELEKSLMKTRDFSDMITKVLDQKKGLAEEKKTKSLLQTDRFFDALNKRLNS